MYKDNWTQPCILECLLNDKQKTRKLLEVLNELELRIQAWPSGRGFNIVKA